MKIINLINRAPGEVARPLPWNDPEFSARVLKHHLSQEHDWASRREDIIKGQVDWLAGRLNPGARVLDLACGPGFYTHLLARRGFRAVGVDFSPAAIAYARRKAAEEGLAGAEYVEADIRDFRPEGVFDCVLFVFGEFNEFEPPAARLILARAREALAEGGFLLLEEHAFEEVRDTGQTPPSWWACPENEGILSARPHVCLQENSWDEALARATLSYLVLDAATAEIDFFRSIQTGYAPDKLRALLAEIGYTESRRLEDGEWPVGLPFQGRMAAWFCPKGDRK